MMISNNLFSLEGKTALVTGGSTGLGLMATAGLAAAGAKVFIVSRKLENCEKAANKINNCDLKGQVVPFKGDLSSEAGISNIVNELQKKIRNFMFWLITLEEHGDLILAVFLMMLGKKF